MVIRTRDIYHRTRADQELTMAGSATHPAAAAAHLELRRLHLEKISRQDMTPGRTESAGAGSTVASSALELHEV
jgi:hypothetical protein